MQDQMGEYKNPQEAFEYALSTGILSHNQQASNWVGHYMYMGTVNGRDLFKHSLTRQYIK